MPRLPDDDYSAAAARQRMAFLGAAVVADEWVTAHERLGRNRP